MSVFSPSKEIKFLLYLLINKNHSDYFKDLMEFVDQLNLFQSLPQYYEEIMEYFFHTALADGGTFKIRKLVDITEKHSKEETVTIRRREMKTFHYINKGKNYQNFISQKENLADC